MALTERLAVILEAHSGSLVSEFTKAAKAADKVGASAKGAQGAVDKVGDGADRTGGLLGKLADKAGVSSNALKIGLGTAGVAALGAVGAAAIGALHTFEDLANQVDDFQDVAGGTAEQASKLVNVTKQLGIDPALASKAFFILGKNIGDGKSKLADFGIEVAKNKDGTTDLVGTLGKVSAAYQGTADQAEKNAIAAAAFGKAGAGLPDLLSLTAAQLKALGNRGPVFSQQEIDNAKQLEIQTRALGQDLEKYKAKAGSFIASHALDFAGGLGRIEEALHIIPKGAALAGLAERQLGASASLAADMNRKAAEARAQEKKDTDALRDSLLGTRNAEVAYGRSQESVAAAERNVADKRKALNDLLHASVVDLKAVDQATRALTDANRGLESAQARAAEAKRRLDEALAGPSADDLQGAQLDLQDATLGVADAQDRLTQAQSDVNDAMAAGDPAAVADANRQLQHATIDLERAQRTQAGAQKALNDLDPNSEAGAQRIAAAYKDLADANYGVDQAQRQVADSATALATVQAGDPDRAAKIAAAYTGLVDAQNGLVDANNSELSALFALNDARFAGAVLLGAGGDAPARLHTELEGLAKVYPQVAPLLQGLLGQTGTTTTYIPGTGIPLNAPSSVGRRAAGGPVGAGETYLVGERGPELLTMGSRGGFVTPHGGFGAPHTGGTTINLTVNALDPKSASKAVVEALRIYQNHSGPIPVRVTGH